LTISEGIVATHLKRGGIFSDGTIKNFFLILRVKKFWKVVNIWWSYKAYKNVPIFGPPCTCINRDEVIGEP